MGSVATAVLTALLVIVVVIAVKSYSKNWCPAAAEAVTCQSLEG